MAKRLLDTSILIRQWLLERRMTRRRAVALAKELIQLKGTNVIASPVVIEFLAGTRNRAELEFARLFLNEFEVADQQAIPARDWEQAQRLAQRVPRDGKPRHLGDCLIRAIAHRLHYDVETLDDRFV